MKVAAIIVLLAALAASDAMGKSLGAIDETGAVPTFGYLAKYASRIARVRIVRQTPVRIGLMPSDPVCGYALDAIVVEPLKGGSSPFTFLSTSQADLDAPSRDYFAIVFSHEPLAISASTSLVFLANPKMSAVARCLLSQQNYVPALFQTLWPFTSSGRTDHDTLLLSDKPSPIHCDVRSPAVSTVIRMKETDVHGRRERSASWLDVRQLFLAQLKHPTDVTLCEY